MPRGVSRLRRRFTVLCGAGLQARGRPSGRFAFTFCAILLPWTAAAARAQEYVGDAACRSCHASIYASYKRTAMGRSMRLPDATDEVPPPGVEDHGIAYSTFTDGGKLFQRETAAGFTDRREVAYEVGSGEHGRSYLLWLGDSLFVSPLSYYSQERRWALSPGHDTGLYHGFTRPAGGLCVYCHSGLPRRIPGTWNRFRRGGPAGLAIGCERCHGPGEAHVAAHGAAAMIVNPARLPNALRDDVCNQCHLAGDARVLQPGKREEDFRPGAPLDDVVSIFSVPPSVKPSGLQALSHVAQLHLSRCWNATQGRLGCITCHDPHQEPQGTQAAMFFRGRCLSCHLNRGCTEPAARRARTQPADNCIACHMPRRPLTNIGHTALTDHRILRSQDAAPAPPLPAKPALIRETQPGKPPGEVAELRTLALAYAQVAENYAAYGREGFPVLQRAARELPNDPDVQATYGMVLLVARPGERAAAESVLQHAIDLGSQSPEARLRLAGALLEDGHPAAAVPLCEDALRISPYSANAYLRLGWAYGQLGEHAKAVAALEKLLSFDPANESARTALVAERQALR